MGLFWGKKNEEASPALVVEETEPVEEPSRYDNLSHAEKEARMLDTIYEMAKTIERLERDIQQIKEDASEAHYWARQRR